MKYIKKALRIAGLILMILLASFGIGIMGALLPEQRTPMKKEDTIEQVEEEAEGQLKEIE